MPMREVRSAHRVRIIHTSGYRAGESYSQARLYCKASASATWAGVFDDVANAHEMSTSKL